MFQKMRPFSIFPQKYLKSTNFWCKTVCDETQNLNDTDSETFFRYQIFSRPIPRLFSVPKFFETDSETFFGTHFFRDRFRDFFRYQIFSIPVPIPSKKLKNSREREFPGPGCHTLVNRCDGGYEEEETVLKMLLVISCF